MVVLRDLLSLEPLASTVCIHPLMPETRPEEDARFHLKLTLARGRNEFGHLLKTVNLFPARALDTGITRKEWVIWWVPKFTCRFVVHPYRLVPVAPCTQLLF